MTHTPRLEIYPKRIQANAQAIVNQCHARGIKVAAVTKVTSAHPAVVAALEDGGADMLADSRIANLQAIARTGTALPLMLLRIPEPSRAVDVVRSAQVSLNSSAETIRLLSEAAGLMKIRHQVILMVDLGDLREGVWPDRAVEVVRSAASQPNIELIGLGCNLACYGGVIPTTEKMQMLIDVRDACRKATGLELNVLCGGNSANLPLLAEGGMPEEINLLRIGEAIVLGRNVIDRSPWMGTRQDTFKVVAEVVEVERKPSVPVGFRGQDAFGGTPEFVDRGIRQRAICNIGRQDVVVDGLEPEDKGIIVLGGSSDHLLLDVEEAASEVKPGDELAFFPGYGALLAASTSPYMQKVVIQE
ncbi:MAG TPA: alanine/ornithine racemase family PLP-dependent enzyme [Anaerolineaceae bacterium]|nr:alanine/ornithine racemase family PLP-dependent enzyme [Anaerolineaceae bacterium]HPN52880.1 alanine/ornithine racemase family PLP-dependent enzyme [Anaerolineaceae bacterium]